MSDDVFDKFLEEILEAKKLSGVDPDVHNQLMNDLRDSLADQINRAVLNALPEDKLEEFNNLLDDPAFDDEKSQAFIASTGIDVRKITIETMLTFRDLYLQTPEERDA